MDVKKEYPFDFSVIMAVYNAEPFLAESIDSLIAQEFGFERIQLILVNDGSRDHSGEICDAYKARYPQNIVVVHKENGGVASARNEGLRHAAGRFLNFMDSDDKFSSDAFGKVYDFFVAHEEQTDVVTIPLHFFDAQQGEHWQNIKFRAGTCCIDLNVDYQSPVSFVNASFFAGRLRERIEFDPRLCCGEDMKVLLMILSEKMKLGVVSDCQYLYRKRSAGEESLIQSSRKKRSWYTDYFTSLIDETAAHYQQKFGYLPAFVQYMLLGDLQWRFIEVYDMTGVLSEEEIKAYKARLYATLRYFDDRYFMEIPRLVLEYKAFMLGKKYGRAPQISINEDDVAFHYGNTLVASVKKMYTLVEFAQIRNGKLTLEGQVRLCGADAQTEIGVVLLVNGRRVRCTPSKRACLDEYRLDELLYRGITFRGEIELEESEKAYHIELALEYMGAQIVKRNIRYGKFVPASAGLAYSGYFRDGWLLDVSQEGIQVRRCGAAEHAWRNVLLYRELFKRNALGDRKAIAARCAAGILKIFKRRPVWLVSDRVMNAGDNGEVFFVYLQQHAKGKVNPYFVLSPDSPDYERLSKTGKVVKAQSFTHKILHLLCDVNISSHADDVTINPFFGHDEAYRDLLADIRFIFLQHGIIYNDASRYFNRYKINADGFVTSTPREQAAIQEACYGYPDESVWLTGLPRYDRLENHPQRIISIMPTWRAYLVTANEQTGVRSLKPGFENSSYYQMYQQLLLDERLADAAKRYGYRIHFICHPNMKATAPYFRHTDAVEIREQAQSYQTIFAQSDLLVTDYSSAAFDFSYLRKPVIYFQQDKDEFYSGRHTVSKGYFDYETDALGEVTYSVDELVCQIIAYMQNGCALKENYRERIDRFFAYSDRGNCERVYRKISQ